MKKNYLFHVILAYSGILNSTLNRNTVAIGGVEEQILIEEEYCCEFEWIDDG